MDTSKAGTERPNSYIITLKDNVSLETFKTFLEGHGLSTKEFSNINGLQVTIPRGETLGELKEMLLPACDLVFLQGKEKKNAITNPTEVCTLFKAHPNIRQCELERQGWPL